MNTPKHTPGPWHIGSGGVIFADHNDQPDAVTVANIPEQLSRMSHYANNAAAMGNARLIAAAPELLVACRAAAAYLVEPASKYKENRDQAAALIFAALKTAEAS